MPINITMPALSPTMETGTLAKWLVTVGHRIRPGDVIAEIETDKATMEVEAVDEGVIAQLVVAEGTDDVPVGQVIAILAEDGESLPAAAPASASAEAASATGHILSPAVRRLVVSHALDPTGIAGTGKDGRLTKGDVLVALENGSETSTPSPAMAAVDAASIHASALAKRIATATGIDLARVAGSGASGRVVLADIRPPAAPAAAPPATSDGPGLQAAAPGAVSTPVHAAPDGVPMETVKLSNMRRTIARRLAESKQTVPHFYLSIDVCLDALLEQRERLNIALDGRAKLSVNDFLIKALALALVEVPDANVQFAGDQLYRFSRADVSVAVAIPGGLVTPVVRAADTKRLSEISNEMKDLAARARDGKLQPTDYAGGTASLSNLGMFGIRAMTPVISPPQGLIVGVGAGERRAVVEGDMLAIGTVSSVTASFDHRAIDGAVGAQFLSALKGLIERPLAMLG